VSCPGLKAGQCVRVSGLEKRPAMWEIPKMKVAEETKIDDRCRPGCMTGLVKPGERYRLEKTSPTEIHMKLMVVQDELPKARLVRKNGRTCLVSDRQLTNEDVQQAMAEFP
jgi:hypothetical protein